MINPDGIYRDPATGKWRVNFGGEWLATFDDYEQADDFLRGCYCPADDDDYYNEGEACGIIGNDEPWDDFERDYRED